jgi:hypothetical protein
MIYMLFPAATGRRITPKACFSKQKVWLAAHVLKHTVHRALEEGLYLYTHAARYKHSWLRRTRIISARIIPTWYPFNAFRGRANSDGLTLQWAHKQFVSTYGQFTSWRWYVMYTFAMEGINVHNWRHHDLLFRTRRRLRTEKSYVFMRA